MLSSGLLKLVVILALHLLKKVMTRGIPGESAPWICMSWALECGVPVSSMPMQLSGRRPV